MAGCSKKQYAIMMSAGPEGEQLAAKMGGMAQEEFDKAFAELLGSDSATEGVAKAEASGETPSKWSKDDDEDYAEFDADSDDDLDRDYEYDRMMDIIESSESFEDGTITQAEFDKLISDITEEVQPSFDDPRVILEDYMDEKGISIFESKDGTDDYGFDEEDETEVDDTTGQKVYTMPSDNLTDEDYEELKSRGIEIIGNKGGDVSLKGSESDLKDFFENYVGVEMDENWLVNEENFDYETYGGTGKTPDEVRSFIEEKARQSGYKVVGGDTLVEDVLDEYGLIKNEETLNRMSKSFFEEFPDFSLNPSNEEFDKYSKFIQDKYHIDDLDDARDAVVQILDKTGGNPSEDDSIKQQLQETLDYLGLDFGEGYSMEDAVADIKDSGLSVDDWVARMSNGNPELFDNDVKEESNPTTENPSDDGFKLNKWDQILKEKYSDFDETYAREQFNKNMKNPVFRDIVNRYGAENVRINSDGQIEVHRDAFESTDEDKK